MIAASEFPGLAGSTYLNSCAHGLLPARTRRALDAHLDRWMTDPDWDEWSRRIEEARRAFARFIHARPEEIAIHSTAGSAMASVMTALDRESQRREVVTLDVDFPTAAAVAQRQRGLRHVHVQGDKRSFDEAAWRQAVGERTALASVPAVASFTGRRLDVARLAEHAHAKGAAVFVDAFQACGTFDVDVRRGDVDFLATGVYKWLLAPVGLAFLYVRRDWFGLEPQTSGWTALEEPYAFDPLAALASDARRFQVGGSNVMGCVAAASSIGLLEEVGLGRIERHHAALTQLVVDGARERKFDVLTPEEPSQRGSIVTFRVRDLDGALAALARERVAVNPRLGGIRVSPHFYNSERDVERLFEVLDAAGV